MLKTGSKTLSIFDQKQGVSIPITAFYLTNADEQVADLVHSNVW